MSQSHLFLTRLADFSPRGAHNSEFLRASSAVLFGPAGFTNPLCKRTASQAAEKLVLGSFRIRHDSTSCGKTRFLRLLCIRARLYRLPKNLFQRRFVSGHDFSRADKFFLFVFPRGLQPAGRSAFQNFCLLTIGIYPCAPNGQGAVASLRLIRHKMFFDPLGRISLYPCDGSPYPEKRFFHSAGLDDAGIKIR